MRPLSGLPIRLLPVPRRSMRSSRGATCWLSPYRRGIPEFEQARTSPNRPKEQIISAQGFLHGALAQTSSAPSAVHGLVTLEWAMVNAHTAHTEHDRKKIRAL